MQKVLIVGVNSKGALENSYLSALLDIGCEVSFFDYNLILGKYIKFGKIGTLINRFFPVFAWQKKMNREFVIMCKEKEPDFIFYFTNAPIFGGSILCVKTINKAIKHVLIWPDTPLNIENFILNNANLYDFAATYSSESVDAFKLANFKKVGWIPLAADQNMFKIKIDQNINFKFDIGFVGGWRPEREAVMMEIIEKFPNLKIGIYGPYWNRECKGKLIYPYILGNGLYEEDLALFFKNTKININIIDDTNYPSANMRFFEIPISGGLQLCSKCPEFENIFQDKKHILYFNSLGDLKNIINWCFTNEEETQRIRLKGFELVNSNHLYRNRVEEILNTMKND